MIETNFYISGVAVYENELLILSYFKESDDEEVIRLKNYVKKLITFFLN